MTTKPQYRYFYMYTVLRSVIQLLPEAPRTLIGWNIRMFSMSFESKLFKPTHKMCLAFKRSLDLGGFWTFC